MRNNILTLLVGFVVMLGSVMLFKLGLDKMTDAEAATTEAYTRVNVDMDRRAILYRVQTGDTLWGLADRFYGNGRRWNEIARANNLTGADGLAAGSVIKIPLGAQDDLAEPEQEEAPALPLVSYDAVEEAVNAGRFGLDHDTIDVAMCRADREEFPSGVLCVARHSEQHRVRLSLYNAHTGADEAPLAVYEAPRGQHLRALHAADTNGDGEQEIYTIWHTGDSDCTSRVLKWVNGELRVISETPEDPMALMRLRNRD